ncbi:farnesol dehydrogenase-like [Topomyia yanbarensis]|uniref:farnesol dehydrogenase-like n=1 Tax=Topomyia yanbarensis TaxID=2498891 RepID=UPI00273B7B70|nr:farnesol dehydrogenase-like [Topomyia yanbarensis]
MNRWKGKVAVVTGASSGIGAATAKALVKAGLVVVGLARRVERVDALKGELDKEIRHRLNAIKCDISKEDDILNTFKLIEVKFGGVDVLINNAGVLRRSLLLETGNIAQLREVIDTNVMGLVMCSQQAYTSMKNRAVDGHIVHINSILGHHLIDYPGLSIYPASKFAVTAITETMRQELRKEGTKIKVTSISPGVVRTEMTPEDIAKIAPALEAEDIANAIVYVLGTPPRVQIHELIIKPVGENF